MNTKIKWSKIALMGLVCLSILTAAGVIYAAEGGHAVSKSLSHEKLMDLLYRVLNFIALLGILIFALKKPIAGALSSRQQSIRDQFEELELRKEEAENLYKEYEGKLSRIDEEVTLILDIARKQAEVEKEKIIAEANRAANDMKRQAEMAVQFELTQFKKRLRDDVVDQATAMAEKLLKNNLRLEDQNKLVDSYLDKVGGLQ